LELREKVAFEIPTCYKWREDGLCEGLWSNDYAYRKCRFCGLFPYEWCENCKNMRFHGPHISCILKDYPHWIAQKSIHKSDDEKSKCPNYERR